MPLSFARLLLGILFLASTSCTRNKIETTSFKSDFQQDIHRVWIGPEYRAKPLQDWQLSEGRIECLVSNENRYIYLLTRQIDKNKGTLKLSVHLGLLNNNIYSHNANWVGFRIGIKGELNDHNNTAFGKGLDVGITTNGSLFIGEPGKNGNNSEIINLLKEGGELVVEASPFKEKYALSLYLNHPETGELLAKIGKRNISEEELTGGIALVSNFKDRSPGKINEIKSVWFSDWEISGSKLSESNDHGTNLFSQYKLNRNVLKTTAQMAPVDEAKKSSPAGNER